MEDLRSIVFLEVAPENCMPVSSVNVDLLWEALSFLKTQRLHVTESTLNWRLVLRFLIFTKGDKWVRLLNSRTDVLVKIAKVVNSQRPFALPP